MPSRLVYLNMLWLANVTRWWLVRPTKSADPSSQLSQDPRPAQESIITQIAPRTDTYHIPAALWKQSDDYFIIDDPVNKPSDRYKPDKIRGYNVQSAGLSVDESRLGQDEKGKAICCGPWETGDDDSRCALPQHRSEKVEVIVLQPVPSSQLAQAAAPAEGAESEPDMWRRTRE